MTIRRGQPWHDFWRNRSAVIGVILVGVFAVSSLAASVIVPVPYIRVGVGPMLQPPSWSYPMGTDDLGRDILAGVVYGSRISLIVGSLSIFFATCIGIGMGLLAGYCGGIVDEILMRIVEFFQVLPSFVLAIVLVAIVGPSLWNVVFAIAALSWPLTARLIRAEVLSLREREYVQSAKVLGASGRYVAFCEILPNALAPAIINGSLDVGRAILTEASLSYLGLGDANRPSLGYMVSYAQALMRQAYWPSVFPGLSIVLVVMAFNLIGDGLNDMWNPRN